MKIEYQGKTYTVGNRYMFTIRERMYEGEPQQRRVSAKLVFHKYSDGEGYADYEHYGLQFEYKRVWRGVERLEYRTFPDMIGG